MECSYFEIKTNTDQMIWKKYIYISISRRKVRNLKILIMSVFIWQRKPCMEISEFFIGELIRFLGYQCHWQAVIMCVYSSKVGFWCSYPPRLWLWGKHARKALICLPICSFTVILLPMEQTLSTKQERQENCDTGVKKKKWESLGSSIHCFSPNRNTRLSCVVLTGAEQIGFSNGTKLSNKFYCTVLRWLSKTNSASVLN